jgi:phage terminase large subunit-like protein
VPTSRPRQRTARPEREIPRIFPAAIPWEDCRKPEELIPAGCLRDPHKLGARAWRLAQALTVTEGRHAGKPFGSVALEWQRRLVIALFGHVDHEQRRIFRRAYLKIARKSGKTAFASIIAMVAALLTMEGRPQTLLLGGSRDQANLAFNNLRAMIEHDAGLRRRFHIAQHRHVIEDSENGGQIIAASADLTSSIGKGASVAIVDELHLIGTLGSTGADLVRSIETGQGAVEEPLLMYVTTASLDTPAGVYANVDEYAHKVARGEVDDRRFLPVLFEMLPGEDADDPATWWRSNPSIGTTATLGRLIEDRDAARARSAADERAFRSQNLNIDPRSGMQSGAWLDMACDYDPWVDGNLRLDDLREYAKRANAIAMGIDLGGADDVSVLAVILRGHEAERPAVFVRGWLSRRGYAVRRNRADLDAQIEDGSLVIVPEVGDDVDALLLVAEELIALDAHVVIGCDPYSMKAPALRLAEAGCEPLAIAQGWKLSPYIDAAERDLLRGRYAFAPSRLLRDHLSNATITLRGEARSITKPDSVLKGARKIDAAVAWLCAAAVLETLDAAPVAAIL